jgi:hypothetical protein
VFENRVVRTILTYKSDEITVGWRKLQNEELHILHSSPSIGTIKLRRMTWAMHVARLGEYTIALKLLFNS